MELTKTSNRRTIHALIVNYNQPQFCEHAIKYLIKNNWPELTRKEVDLSIHWIDNSGKSPCQFRDRTREFVDEAGVKWHDHLHSANLGFGQACQKAFENIESSDLVLLVNPDAELTGLGAMFDSLRNASELVAGIGPQSYWDSEKRFFLPPTWLTDEAFIKNECLARYLPSYARYRSRELRKASLRIWTSTQTTPIGAISGACGLFRVSSLRSVGGLFDKAFFMYWEDTELMLRLNRAGLKTLLEPNAHLIHKYEHSVAKSKMIESGRENYLGRLNLPSHWFELHNQNSEELWPCETIYLEEGKDLKIPSPQFISANVQSTNNRIALWEMGLSSEFVPTIGTFSNNLTIPWELLARVLEMPIYIRTIIDPHELCWKVVISKRVSVS